MGVSDVALDPNAHWRYDILFEVAKISTAGRDLGPTLSHCLASISETWLAAETSILLLYDPDRGRLVVQAAHGYNISPLSQIHVTAGTGMSGKAFRDVQVGLYSTPEAVSKARSDLVQTNRELFEAAARERMAGSQRAVSGDRFFPCSALCVPLLAQGQPIGALILENWREPASFGPQDEDLARDVAQLVALAVGRLAGPAAQGQGPTDAEAGEAASRFRAELISTLAHEMRTPLTSIKGYSTALLMDEVRFDPRTQQEFLQIIDEECDTLETLIHDLLESSLIDAGRLKLEPQPVMLHRLVGGLVAETEHRTRRHRFLVDFPSDFPLVDADPRRIEQVLRNLLDNAAKYSPQGGMVVVRGEVRPSQVLVSVADQGVGIAPEHLNRLFEKFFRIESSFNHHIVGSGLGLPIARTIVEAHGGHIWAESKLGEGSTFCFTLPVSSPLPGTGHILEGEG